jgi:hypothetical protein
MIDQIGRRLGDSACPTRGNAQTFGGGLELQAFAEGGDRALEPFA